VAMCCSEALLCTCRWGRRQDHTENTQPAQPVQVTHTHPSLYTRGV